MKVEKIINEVEVEKIIKVMEKDISFIFNVSFEEALLIKKVMGSISGNPYSYLRKLSNNIYSAIPINASQMLPYESYPSFADNADELFLKIVKDIKTVK